MDAKIVKLEEIEKLESSLNKKLITERLEDSNELIKECISKRLKNSTSQI